VRRVRRVLVPVARFAAAVGAPAARNPLLARPLAVHAVTAPNRFASATAAVAAPRAGEDGQGVRAPVPPSPRPGPAPGAPADHPAGAMFWLRRKRLSGSYFALIAASRS
jgi:hypothetical protein